MVLELHDQYRKRCMRIRGYQRLLLYLAYIVLYLVMLYAQRDAAAGHAVHSVVHQNLVPEPRSTRSWAGVYDYLASQAARYWRDPVCGNGICEAPYEYPSYARFGCTADCGFLVDAVPVEPLQVCAHACRAVCRPSSLLRARGVRA